MRMLAIALTCGALAIVLGTSPSSAQENKGKIKEFEYTAWMKRTEAELKALGYLGKTVERVNVPVSEKLTVEKVPVTFVKAHCEHATHVVGALEYPTRKSSEIPKAVMGLAEYWLVPQTVAAEKAALKQRPMLDLIRADAKLHAELVKHFGKPGEGPDKVLAGLPGSGLSARELLPVSRAGEGIRFNFTPIPIVQLLGRFEPHAEVTEQTADSVAEETVWTKALGISDATYKTLPQARLILQAAILENLNFEIGNPGDKDNDKAAKAKAKLAEAKKTLIETWRKAAEGK